ncbi:hypothetical protein EWM64_g1784 [Hericium alpestre]|uniref:Uncharacterized protein n=1 Tax=Hericium alpestre TaxID=135208 RepID=A0A4Z0A674_9AGAM|nr:hypothetical protein EWM64_g1784 [Hericium alpestre]
MLLPLFEMICIQELKGSPGCAKVHHKTPLKLGPRRRARRCELRVSRQKRLQPMEQLPPEYIVTSKKQCCYIPELHYCIGVDADTLYDYALKHCLMPSNVGFASDDARRFCGLLEATKGLARLSGAILFLQEPVWSAEDPWLLARHSNHNWFYHMNVLNGPPDEEVFDIVRQELAISGTPKWYQIVT